MNQLPFLQSVKNSIKIGVGIFFFFFFGGSFFGIKLNAQFDTLNNRSEFTILHAIEQVRISHPLQEVAKLNADFGSAYLLSKKGAFDPYLALNVREKNFSGKQYYQGTESKLSLPTFSPVSGEMGFDNWQGSFTNPELNTGLNGQQYIGLNISLLKGLITDQRRTELQKARLFKEQTLFEQKNILNQTASEIWLDYIDWYLYYREVESLKFGVELTTQRQIALRELFFSGGCNGMDTLENSIQLNLFKARLQQGEVNLYKAKLTMSKHLWRKEENSKQYNYTPLEIADTIFPSALGLNFLDSAFSTSLKIADVLDNVPYLNVLESKVNQKELEMRLRKQDILPKLDLKYQLLSAGLGSTDFDLNNQRFGIAFSSPLFLRKELGNYRMAKYDFKQMELEYKFKENEVRLKIKSLKFQVQNNRELYKQFNDIANGYRQLYEMEREKFSNGDGTVFLINTRELRFLDSQLKSIEQQRKYLNSVVEFLNATGEIQYSIF